MDRVTDNRTICKREEFEKRYRAQSPYAMARGTLKEEEMQARRFVLAEMGRSGAAPLRGMVPPGDFL